MNDLNRLIRFLWYPIHDGLRYYASRSHGGKELDQNKGILLDVGLQICKGIYPVESIRKSPRFAITVL